MSSHSQDLQDDSNSTVPKSLRTNQHAKSTGRPPVPKEKLLKHSRGEGMDGSGVKVKLLKKKIEKREKMIEYSTEQAARLEILLPEDSGSVFHS